MEKFSKLIVNSRSENCLVTLNLSRNDDPTSFYEKVGSITIPSMEKYARKNKINFEIINKNLLFDDFCFQSNVLAKLQVFDLLKIYKKIFFVDLDCYISIKCDSVFEKYKDAKFACATFLQKEILQDVIRLAERLGLPKPNNLGINAGVFLADRDAVDVFKLPDLNIFKNELFGAAEENWMTLILINNPEILTEMHWNYNNSWDQLKYNIFHAVCYKSYEKCEVLKKLSDREHNKNKILFL